MIRVRSIPLSVVITTVTPSGKPNLAVGLITTRDSGDRPAEEGIGILPYVAELTAIIVASGAGLRLDEQRQRDRERHEYSDNSFSHGTLPLVACIN